MIIKTKEKFELEEKLKTANEEEVKKLKKRLEGLDIYNCKHIFIESESSYRGAWGADERWVAHECINCGLTNAAIDNCEFQSAVISEWSKIRHNGWPIISDEGFYRGYIKEFYNKALNDAEDEFDREEVAYLLKKYIKKAREVIEERNKLEQRKKDIDLIDAKLAELSKLPIKDLADIKYKYYIDYFNLHRREHSLLEDIPPYEYFKSKLNAVHPLSEYSKLNVVLLGEFIAELFKKYEQKDVESYIRFKNHKINENKSVDVPNIIIGKNPKEISCNHFNNEDNIIIPLSANYEIFRKDGYIDGYVRYSAYDQSDSIVCFSPKRQLMGYNEELYNLDYKGHTFIRDLIYTLAYYQKEMGVKDVDDEYLRNAFKRIYKL